MLEYNVTFGAGGGEYEACPVFSSGKWLKIFGDYGPGYRFLDGAVSESR